MSKLSELQALPFETKLLWTYARVSEALEYCDEQGLTPFVSLSGGKDSWVLKEIVHAIRTDVQCVLVNTGLEYPEVISHARQVPGLIELRPAMSFVEVLQKYGYPVVSKQVAMSIDRIRGTKSILQIDLRMHGGVNPSSGKAQRQTLPDKWKFLLEAPFLISEKCCNVMKKKPLAAYTKQIKGMPFIGTLASDNENRRVAWEKSGCNTYAGLASSSRPLSIWTEQDVLRYIVEFGLSIAPVYGEIQQTDDGLLHCTGEQRTGCIFCLFGIFMEQKKRRCNRFQRMYVTHPQLWTYCMDKLGIRQVMEFLGLPIKPQEV